MEEKKTPATTGTENNPEVKVVDKETVITAPEEVVSPAPIRKQNHLLTAAALALVIFALGAVWMRLEKEGRVDTSFFSSIIASQEAAAPVAVVNGKTLLSADLALSIEQLNQAASAQGRNPQDADVQVEIQKLAVDMLVNTTLLQQVAEQTGINITEEQVLERMSQLEIESGGVEVLEERMAQFGIDRETFAADVRTELTIVTLLDTVFAKEDLTVSQAEVVAVYEQAGGTQPGAPALEEVQLQIEAQIRQSKEQTIVDSYLDELRAAADIEIVS